MISYDPLQLAFNVSLHPNNNLLVFVTSTWVWLQFAAIEGGVPHATIVALHIHLGT